jgi:ParB/RepB/Spo0J family partition protein
MRERGATTMQPVEHFGTSLSRARLRRPVQVERLRESLAVHGQLTAVVVTERQATLEVIDGFKRLEAARQLGWMELRAQVMDLEDQALWATMLLLNRGPQSMTELEEALVLRELQGAGLSQTQIGELIGRHKSWVSRRIGLVERLHPELVEGIRLALIAPGVARRLLSLPPGNQLELAAAAQNARLGPRETERLVSLWQSTTDPAARRYLLEHPRTALEHADPKREPAADPRLTAIGQRLWRLLRVVQEVAPRATRLVRQPPAETDLPILARELAQTAEAVSRLGTALGWLASGGSADASNARDATS